MNTDKQKITKGLGVPGLVLSVFIRVHPWPNVFRCILETPMFAYDDQVLAAVQPVPQSVDDVIGAMQAIDAICADGDGLKWFNRLYLDVTEAVKARVDAGGEEAAGEERLSHG
jgi:hypothetical protein